MAKAKAAKQETASPATGRFRINGDNTITDQKTGLLIIQDPTQLGEAFQETMTHADALAAIAKLNETGYAGHKDWRLPTVEEICGMIDRKRHHPCYNTDIFKGKFDNWYWSGDDLADEPAAAWCVRTFRGRVDRYNKNYTSYVRPVRSSQCQFDHLLGGE